MGRSLRGRERKCIQEDGKGGKDPKQGILGTVREGRTAWEGRKRLVGSGREEKLES